MTFGFGLAIVGFLYLGGREVIRGALTLGEFVAFNGYLGQLAWPLIAFGWVTNMFQRGLGLLAAHARRVRHAAVDRRQPRRARRCRSRCAATCACGT